jgi:citronellol/citronellal dehydrogenase
VTTRALSGKVAFVAGASRGIGRDIAVALAAAGAGVAVAARTETPGKVPGTIHSVVDRITQAGGEAFPVRCDVTDEASVEGAVAAAIDHFGALDVVVCNAGAMWLQPTAMTPLKRWDLCLRVNLTGVFLVTRATLPHVRDGGSYLAITTSGVRMIELGSNAYWVSKAGVERLYLGLAADLKDDNIAVNCLSPSRVVLTEGWQAGGAGMEIPPEMVEPPEAMANAAVLLAQQDASGITGTIQRSEELTF